MKLEKITAKGAEHLYRHSKTGIIYYRQYRKGFGELFRSTKTKSLNDAKEMANSLKLSFLKQEEIKKLGRVALEEFDLWIERKRSANKAPATITSMRSSRKYLKIYLHEMTLDQITAEWWEGVYIPQVKAATTENRRFFNDRKWLSMFMIQMVADGKISKAPKLINPDTKSKPGRVYTHDQVSQMIEHANFDLQQMIRMAATMGMRRLEITNLRWDRVDLKKQVIHLREEDTKIRKARSFKISAEVLPGLRFRAKNGSPFVFPNKFSLDRPVHKDGFTGSWKRLKAKLKIKGRFHDLRHTFLTNAFKAPGSNAAFICHYAGLTLEEAQKTYLHFDENDTAEVAKLVRYA